MIVRYGTSALSATKSSPSPINCASMLQSTGPSRLKDNYSVGENTEQCYLKGQLYEFHYQETML